MALRVWIGLTLIWMVVPPAARPQTLVTGIVRDAATNAAIPGATVQVENTFLGAVTNEDGKFEIAVDTLPATLVVSRIGYTSHRLVIDSGGRAAREILLVPAVFDLEPIIVTEPQSAADIMRKVIARKQAWRSRLRALRADAYSRFTVENEKDIVFIIEGLADATWDHDRGWKAAVKSYRRSSNNFIDDDLDDLQTLDRLASEALVLNMYDDEIDLIQHDLMGVTHPKALDAYDFELQGQRLLDDKIVYDIGVKPESRLFSGFVGRISVLDGDYAMIETDLAPGPAFIFPPPVRAFDIRIKQQFARFGEGFWLPVGSEIQSNLKVGIIGFVFPDLKARLVSRLSDYRVFGAPDTTAADTSTVTRTSPPPLPPVQVRIVQPLSDSLLAAQGKMTPLSEREQKAYETIDTTMTFFKAFEPEGFIAAYLKRRGVFDAERGEEAPPAPNLSGRRRRHRSRRQPAAVEIDYTPDFRYNRVDAAHLGLETTLTVRNPSLSLHGSGAYNTGTERWDYGGGATLRWGDRQRHTIAGSYRKGSDPRYVSSAYSPRQTSLLPLFGGDDYFDYFQNERATLRYNIRLGQRRRLALTGGLNFERHGSLPKTTDYALFGIDHVQRPNPAVTPGDLRSAILRAEYGRKPEPFSPERGRYLALDAEFAPSGFAGNDFSFARYQLTFAWHAPTLFRRRMLPNTLDLRVVAGTSTGVLPPQRFGILDGSLFAVSPFGAFKSLHAPPYEGEHHAAVFWEHNFRTVPFEWLGLMPLARRGIGLSVYGGHGRTWIGDARRASLSYTPQYQDRFHHEAGVSINGLFYLFRLDFTKRLDASGFFVGIGIGPGFAE